MDGQSYGESKFAPDAETLAEQQSAELTSHHAKLADHRAADRVLIGGPVCPPHWTASTSWEETGDTEEIDDGLSGGGTITVPAPRQVKRCTTCSAELALDYDPATDPANPAYSGG